jgi:hypothetical protein
LECTIAVELRCPQGPRNGGSALARVGLKDFDAAMDLSPAGEEQNTLENRNAYRPVSILYIRSRLVNPSSHQVRNGNCLSVGNICDSTPVPKILVNRISHHCPTKFGDIRGRANRKNGKYVARYRQEAGSDRS